MTAKEIIKLLYKDGWYEVDKQGSMYDSDGGTMKNITYLAVLEPVEDGSYSIYFPDLPGCISFGKDFVEAQKNAAEAASLHMYNMENDGDAIPVPSTVLSKEDTEGNVVMPVTIYPDIYRNQRRVKTNITLPLWLKNMAEEKKVNYSRLLEKALMEYLGIQVPYTSN